MSGDTEHEELRALQARAYGRDGGLDEAGFTRLQELEGRRLADPSAPAGHDAPEQDAASGETDGAERPRPETTDSADDADAAANAEAAAVETPDPPVVPSAPRWRSFLSPRVALAAVVLLALGTGLGWVLFGRSADAEIPLTAAQYERRAELSENGYDNGSVRAIAQKYKALAWVAEKGDGKLVCLILDVGEQSVQDCQPTKAVEEGGLSAGAISAVVDGESEGDGTASFSAYLMLSTAGEPMVSIQRWDNDNTGWLDQFEGDERDRAEALVAEGYDAQSPTIVGYFQGAPVWLVTRTASGPSEHCLIVDGPPSQEPVCTDMAEAFEKGLTTMLPDPGNDETSETGSVWILRLEFTRWQSPFLTITREEMRRVTSGSEDPIEIEVDGATGDAGG